MPAMAPLILDKSAAARDVELLPDAFVVMLPDAVL